MHIDLQAGTATVRSEQMLRLDDTRQRVLFVCCSCLGGL